MIPARRIFEMFAAVYGGFYGLWVETVLRVSDHPSLWWTGLDGSGAHVVARILIAAGLIHGLGIRVNGRWIYSPVLRSIGMATFCGVFLWLSLHALHPLSTAVFNYFFIGLVLFIGLLSALSDARTAILRRYLWTRSLSN